MKELIEIQAKLKAPKNLVNTFGNYKYRSCESILDAVKPLLETQKCILNLSDSVVLIGERYYIQATATITNETGLSVTSVSFAREQATKKGMDESQITGSSSSYARKYALNGLFLIDDNKDADDQDNSKEPESTKKLVKRNLPWLTPNLFEKAIKRIKDGEEGVYTHLLEIYQLKQEYIDEIELILNQK